MKKLNPHDFQRILFFTGAGMSAECGIPTYRGKGGIWDRYNWQEVACQEAFERNPEKVLEFYEMRRSRYYDCEPHAGHAVITELERIHNGVTVVTQNIDGMHQRAGTGNVIELHGNIWRLRCSVHGVITDHGRQYSRTRCESCKRWLRPDIVWFGDPLDSEVVKQVSRAISDADLFISIGTSGAVWPAAGFQQLARDTGALCIEVNTGDSEFSSLFDERIRQAASTALGRMFAFPASRD